MNSAAYPLAKTAPRENVPLRQSVGSGLVPTLRDLMEDGIYLLFLLRGGNYPSSCQSFNETIDQFLVTFDRVCVTFSKSAPHVHDSKYAFCALLDEILLAPESSLREQWQQNPLQLRLFGEHLAGEGFFIRLDQLRVDMVDNIEVIEIFHTCMLLGFRGKYVLEGREKLAHLIARIGHDIASHRGNADGLAPNWALPFRLANYVGTTMPLWLFGGVVALICVTVFLSFDWFLDRKLERLPAVRTLPQGVVLEEDAIR